MTWVRENMCPDGPLDIWGTDLDFETPAHTFLNVISACEPALIFVDETNFSEDETFLASVRGKNTGFFHRYLSKLFKRARAGAGPYRLLVDQVNSDFQQVGSQERTHSVFLKHGAGCHVK